MGSSKSSANKIAEQDRADEQARQARIREGTSNVNNTFDKQFTSDYYDGLKQNYLNYATPQLDQQYQDAQKQLAYALARSGALNSSVRSDDQARLDKQYGLQQQKIADDALSYEQTAKTNVENARSTLISNLNSTGDATQAANDAIARAGALSTPASYSPLSDLFTTFTSALGKDAAAEKAWYASLGSYGSPGVGLFRNSSSSVSNT